MIPTRPIAICTAVDADSTAPFVTASARAVDRRHDEGDGHQAEPDVVEHAGETITNH